MNNNTSSSPILKRQDTTSEYLAKRLILYSPMASLVRTQEESAFRAAVEAGNFLDPKPLLAARGHCRPPQEVFVNGMSAYDPYRLWQRNQIQLLLFALAVCTWLYDDDPVYATLALALFYAFVSESQSIHQFYLSAYVSGSPALPLSRLSSQARVYAETPTQSWCYGIHLPEGCIDFSAYSKNVLAGSVRMDYAWDATEIFPHDLYHQVIAPSQILFAYPLASVDYQHISQHAHLLKTSIKQSDNEDEIRYTTRATTLESIRKETFAQAALTFDNTARTTIINMGAPCSQTICQALQSAGYRPLDSNAFSQTFMIQPIMFESLVKQSLGLPN